VARSIVSFNNSEKKKKKIITIRNNVIFVLLCGSSYITEQEDPIELALIDVDATCSSNVSIAHKSHSPSKHLTTRTFIATRKFLQQERIIYDNKYGPSLFLR